MHRYPQYTVHSSVMMENTVCLFQTVIFSVVTLYNQEVTRGKVNFHLQNSHDGVIFHNSTLRLKILYLSILSVRQSGWYRQYSGLLSVGWSSVQTLVGMRFSTSIQTSPKAHPASCTMHTVSALGIKQLGCGNYQPSPSSTELPIQSYTSAPHHVLMESSIILEILRVVTTDMPHITTGMHSEKCVVRRFRHCVNVY